MLFRSLSGLPEKLVAKRTGDERAPKRRPAPVSDPSPHMEEITVNLGPRSYPILVGVGALRSVGTRLSALGSGRRTALLSDQSVMALYGPTVHESLRASGFSVTEIVVPEGERAKTLAVAERCWDECLGAGLDRTSTLLALGGGAVGDLAGFVAATYMRGIPFVQLPTKIGRASCRERV